MLAGHIHRLQVLDRARGGRLAVVRFVELPTRPMRLLELDPRGLAADALVERLAALLAAQPADAAVDQRLSPPSEPRAESALRVATLRRLHPRSMIVSVHAHGTVADQRPVLPVSKSSANSGVSGVDDG